MPWTKTTRRHYDRRGLRYASDCTDKEWEIIAVFLERTGRVGRPRRHDLREIWNAVGYVIRGMDVYCINTQNETFYRPEDAVKNNFESGSQNVTEAIECYSTTVIPMSS